MAFDYTTPTEAFDYGNSAGTATDPVNEAGVMARCVTGVSRAIDAWCHQAFSAETYTDAKLTGVVDRDGVLNVYPSVPVMSAPTAAAYRYGASSVWLSLDLANLDIIEASHGCTVRFLGQDFTALRFHRIQVQMSYSGGYADLTALPSDLRWYATALSWLTYQRRTAPMDRTAIPELGVVINPGAWPVDIRQGLRRYMKVVAQ